MHPRDSVLVVDEDSKSRHVLLDYLREHGFDADAAASWEQAEAAVALRAYALVLLEPWLWGSDGLGLALRCRAQAHAGIICITERRDEADVVMGLELGADDYVLKPFSLRELLARMHAVLRRCRQPRQIPVTRGAHPRAYCFDGWTLNLNTRRLQRADGQALELSNAEFNLLVLFLSAPGRIVSRQDCLERTRAFDDVFDRTIDVQVLRLRRKIESDPGRPRLLRTVRGAGYFLDVQVRAVWD